MLLDLNQGELIGGNLLMDYEMSQIIAMDNKSIKFMRAIKAR